MDYAALDLMAVVKKEGSPDPLHMLAFAQAYQVEYHESGRTTSLSISRLLRANLLRCVSSWHWTFGETIGPLGERIPLM